MQIDTMFDFIFKKRSVLMSVYKYDLTPVKVNK